MYNMYNMYTMYNMYKLIYKNNKGNTDKNTTPDGFVYDASN